ncbi:MAG: lamin tail domain-containing protein [Deltaproteobacteria bacterium]|nr:lamin tail domain-containing protein [Deltaproteobacteria bacterium]
MQTRIFALAAAAGLSGTIACSGGSGGGACETMVAGDLVITEVMANPAGEDKGFEWFEIFNATQSRIDLEGVELSSSRADGTDRKYHALSGIGIDPGQYLVFGNASEGALPEWVDYGYGSTLGDLRNSGGRLSVECELVAIDEIVYGDAESGKSQGFDGKMAPDAMANDDLNAWCTATKAFDGDQMGSPGAANEDCEGGVTPGTCKYGFGDERAPVPPKPGDLVITEIMQNPDAVKDADGEWFEVYVVNTVDLNGLQAGMDPSKSPSLTLDSDKCLQYQAGSFVLFAKKDETAINGGLPHVDFKTKISLANTARDPGTGLYLKMNNLILDEVDYEAAGKGKSISLDPDAMTASANDDPANWCPGTEAYGLGDLGTPGAANEDC